MNEGDEVVFSVSLNGVSLNGILSLRCREVFFILLDADFLSLVRKIVSLK